MSNAAIVAQHAFEPASADAAFDLAKRLVASRLMPKAVTSPEAALAIIITGRELGLTAMQSLRGIHIIEGKPVLSSDTMLALALRDERCESFRLVESTAKIATFETKRKGTTEPTRFSFTIEEAQTAGLTTKDNWKKYAPAMLRARCIAALARIVYPDIFLGVYADDELQSQPAVTSSPYVGATIVVKEPDDSLRISQGFAEAIDSASTLDELLAIGRDIAGQKRFIEKGDLAVLSAQYSEKKAALSSVVDEGGSVPPPPPSSPAVNGEAVA